MRVIFRAQFQGPKRHGPLNSIGCDLSRIQMQVDVFRTGNNWHARSNGNPLKLPAKPTHGCMKDAISACFDKALEYNQDGSVKWSLLREDDKIPIDPDYVEETPEGRFSMREVTHVADRNNLAPTSKGVNYCMTACGQEAHVTIVKSFRSPKPPLCKECRVKWAETPEEERFKQ